MQEALDKSYLVMRVASYTCLRRHSEPLIGRLVTEYLDRYFHVRRATVDAAGCSSYLHDVAYCKHRGKFMMRL